MSDFTNPARELRVIEPSVLKADEVRSGFSLRHGGVSGRPFHTLNLGLSTSDAAENVHENRRRLFDMAGLPPGRLAVAGQVHGSRVAVVSDPGTYPGFDALVTRAPQVVLCITSADCAVVLLADVEARVIAACHSGWRGTVAQITRRTVEIMKELGARPDRLRAYVSPSISADHFEVGPDVAAEFAPSYVVERVDWRKPHVDLKGAIADQLVNCNLEPASIEVSPRCTFAETHDFFSYRAENGVTGRMMGFVSLL